jgi:hypothetical protein
MSAILCSLLHGSLTSLSAFSANHPFAAFYLATEAGGLIANARCRLSLHALALAASTLTL